MNIWAEEIFNDVPKHPKKCCSHIDTEILLTTCGVMRGVILDDTNFPWRRNGLRRTSMSVVASSGSKFADGPNPACPCRERLNASVNVIKQESKGQAQELGALQAANGQDV